MYAVLVVDKDGYKTPTVVAEMEAALDLAAHYASNGEQPLLFQSVEGKLVLTAKLVQESNGKNGASVHPQRRPAIIASTGKRTQGDLARVRSRILSYVVTNEGKGVEDMAKSLQVSTKELVLPIRQLIAEKKMSKRGQARAVKYFGPKPSRKPVKTREKKAA